jgi:hypothetical protein
MIIIEIDLMHLINYYINNTLFSHVKVLSKVLMTRRSYDDYTNKNLVFKVEKAQELFNSLPIEDQKLFPCNPKDIEWNHFLGMCYHGMRKYLLKSPTN